MASGHGNVVQHWQVYGEAYIVSQNETTATVRCDTYFHSIGWGYNVNGNGTATVNGQSANSGQVRCYAPTGGTVNQHLVTKDVTVSKGRSAYNVGCQAVCQLTGGYHNGTSTVNLTVGIPALRSSTVSYNANGGTGAPGAQTKWYGSILTLSSTRPTRTGYTFQGWSTSTDSSVEYQPGSQYGADANVTLYAVWRADTWTVSYNANGGSGAPGNQTKVYGQTLTLSSTRPTRNLYNFMGWGTSSGSTTPSYQPGGAYTNNASITLYAIWELAWVAPRITNLQATRCDSAGTFNEEGQYAKVTFDWATDRTVSKIAIVCNGVTVNGSGSGTSGSINLVLGNNALSTENSYPVIVTVTDAVGSGTMSTTVAPMNYIMDINGPRNSVAFGEPATDTNRLTSSMQITPRKGFTYSSWLYGTLGKGQWIKLGTLSSTSDADSAIIDVYSGNGWNSDPMQNSWFRIFIKDSYQASSSTSGAFGVYVYCYNCDSRDIKVDVRAHASNQCDVWIYLSWSYWAGGYDIKTSARWTPGSGSISQSEEPTSGTLQPTRIFSAPMMEYRNGYMGLVNPSASKSPPEQEWIRTTETGLIPYQSGGASALGTESWPFNNVWTNELNWTGNGLGGRVQKTLWSGTVSIGATITVPEAERYNLFSIGLSGWTSTIFGIRSLDARNVRFFGGYDSGTSHENYYASFNVDGTGTKWTYIGGNKHNFTRGEVVPLTNVGKIYGLL